PDTKVTLTRGPVYLCGCWAFKMRRGAYADRIRSRSSHFFMARSLASALMTIGIALFCFFRFFLFFLDPCAAIDVPFFQLQMPIDFRPTMLSVGVLQTDCRDRGKQISPTVTFVN